MSSPDITADRRTSSKRGYMDTVDAGRTAFGAPRTCHTARKIRVAAGANSGKTHRHALATGAPFAAVARRGAAGFTTGFARLLRSERTFPLCSVPSPLFVHNTFLPSSDYVILFFDILTYSCSVCAGLRIRRVLQHYAHCGHDTATAEQSRFLWFGMPVFRLQTWR